MISTRWTVAISLGIIIAAAVLGAWLVRRAYPPINDISTDIDDPPQFVGARNWAAHGGPRLASMQRRAYPDIVPVVLATTPPDAFERARGTAIAMGWTIVSADSAAGRIEATATTPLFRFTDDVLIRVRTHPGGARIDVRSVSRVGRGDLGANARRIRAFVAHLNG